MAEETMFKAEEARKMQRPSSLPALAFIGIGAFLLISNLMGLHLIDLFWPLFIIMPGLLFMWPAHDATLENPRKLAFLAVPGAMMITVGLLLFAMNLTDHFEAWAYSWTLVLAAFSMGRMYTKRHDPDHPRHERGRRFVRLMLLLFIGMAVFFEIIVFESFQPWLPLVLIAYGMYTLVKNRRATEPLVS